MDKITPEDITHFLWVTAALVAFALALWTLFEKFRNAQKPSQNIAAWRRATDQKLDMDKKRIDSLEEGQKAICRGVLALLNHEITGNSVDKLRDAQSNMTEYLINR